MIKLILNYLENKLFGDKLNVLISRILHEKYEKEWKEIEKANQQQIKIIDERRKGLTKEIEEKLQGMLGADKDTRNLMFSAIYIGICNLLSNGITFDKLSSYTIDEYVENMEKKYQESIKEKESK